MTDRCICRPRDPEGWYREDCPTHGATTYGHDCEHTTYQHGADGCNVPGCLCAFMSWAVDDYLPETGDAQVTHAVVLE